MVPSYGIIFRTAQISIILNLSLRHGRNHDANAECVDRKSTFYHVLSTFYLCSYYYMLTMLILYNVFTLIYLFIYNVFITSI